MTVRVRGRDPVITPAAKTWLVALACQKAKELGYPHELWTTRLLAAHARFGLTPGRYAALLRSGSRRAPIAAATRQSAAMAMAPSRSTCAQTAKN